MPSMNLLKDFSQLSANTDGLAAQLINELLVHVAAVKDGQVTKELLKKMVIQYAEAERRLATLNRQLVQNQLQLDADAKAASEIQKALLPTRSLDNLAVEVSWKFQPCDLIGGDLFNVLSLDNHRIGVYIFDVSGHGVPAAMMSVSVSQALRASSGLIVKQNHDTSLSNQPLFVESPAKVMEGLDREFPFSRFDKFFTIFYGVLNTMSGEFCYCNAGHPPPVHFRADGTMGQLSEGGTIIGMGGLVPFEEGTMTLEAGDKILFYTDGIVEFQGLNSEAFGEQRLHDEIRRSRNQQISRLLDNLLSALASFAGETKPQDDVTLLGLEFCGQGE